MFNRFKSKDSPPAAIATNSPKPADFDLGSLESRAAARVLVEPRKHSGTKISLICVGQTRPAWAPSKPKYRNGLIETFYIDDDDYPEN